MNLSTQAAPLLFVQNTLVKKGIKTEQIILICEVIIYIIYVKVNLYHLVWLDSTRILILPDSIQNHPYSNIASHILNNIINNSSN